MMHASVDFTEHMLGLLKKTGPSGPTGPTPNKPFKSNEKVGTTRCTKVGPVDFEWSHAVRATGPAKTSPNQLLTGDGTTGTSGTTIFQRVEDALGIEATPPEWHAILAELKWRNCPDWLSVDRWAVLLLDAENFLSRWGFSAHSLRWTALDLFGVHPIAPASRFDVMGMVFTLQGAEVIALTDRAATIRRRSNAILTYRRVDQTGAVCLTQLVP
jgi:hypothetical protein